MAKQCLHLRAEIDIAPIPRIVKRLDAHTVARQHKTAARLLPDGEAEHTAQPLDRGGAPLHEGVQDDLCVAGCVEPMTERRELLAQLDMVIDFTVEDEDEVLILRYQRLRACRGVDYPKAGGPKRGRSALPGRLIVRAAVDNGIDRLNDSLGQKWMSYMSKSCNSTHIRWGQPLLFFSQYTETF